MSIEIMLDNDVLEVVGNEQEGYMVVDFYVDYQVICNLLLCFFVDNVVDEDYIDCVSYGQEFVIVDMLLELGWFFVLSVCYGF